MTPGPIVAWMRRRLPASTLGWVWLATGLAGVVAVANQLRRILWPLLARPRAIGRHDWDPMEAQRYLVVKSLLRFHQFPFWNPYACGGHPAWAAPQGDPIVVSPLLPVYLALPLQIATRVEVVTFAILSAAGAWALASRFTRSQAARALVAVVFALDGRLAMQIAAGEAWFLVYALAPWALYFFDRAIGAEPSLGPPRRRDLVWCGACLAMMLYAGGVPPLPQTVVILAVYALWLSVAMRSLRPLGTLALTGLVALGLAAPKLAPMHRMIFRLGRGPEPHEHMTLTALERAMTEPTQLFKTTLEGVDPNRWHEVGMYVGGLGLALLFLGLVLARGRREQPLRLLAIALVILSLGDFNEGAPWNVVQHVPWVPWGDVAARWSYPALMLGACVMAGALERLLVRSGRARVALEMALVVLVAWMSRDIAEVARRPIVDEVHEAGPTTPEQTGPFVTETRLPPALDYRPGETAPASLPAEMANVGTIECRTFAALASSPPGGEGRPTELGAHGRADPGYRGEAFLAEGVGTASITSWTPNAVEVRVEKARPGDHLVLNQNWDPGWSVSGADAAMVDHTIAGVLREGTTTVRFRYRPPGLWAGLLLAAATVGALVYARRRLRRQGPC